MNHPAFETLELRTLLSAGTLAAGKAQLFDLNADGVNEAVLVNNGTTPIQYGYTAGNGLDYVNLTADGGKFSTNMFVSEIGDSSPTADFSMGVTKVSMNVTYKTVAYGAIAGDTSVVEGSILQFEVGQGNLLNVQTTGGDLGKVNVDAGNLVSALSAGAIDTLVVNGDILGTISAGGDIAKISANNLSGASVSAPAGTIGKLAVDAIDNTVIDVLALGTVTAGTIGGQSQITTQQDITKLQAGTISDATVTTIGGIGSLIVDTLAGSANGTNLFISGHVGKLQADTLTGGLNGNLYLSIGDGVDNFIVGDMDGGQASGDWSFSSAFVNISGNVANMRAGLISGGTADGMGANASLNVSVSATFDADWNVVQAGDITSLTVAGMSGGESLNGGDAMLNFTVLHDLVDGHISQMIGSGAVKPIHDPSIYLNVGHDIVHLVTGRIGAGNAVGDYGYASVNIYAGNDIQSLTAGQIDAGTAEGDYSLATVIVYAGHDINSITANTFTGGTATGISGLAGLYVTAGRNIDYIGAGTISGTQARTPIADPTVQFVAGGDIGLVMAGRITGGTVTTDGEDVAQASVLLQANGTYIDADGVQSAGDIGQIVTGKIDGGQATGANSLSYVKVFAAHDIDKLYADHIYGGDSVDGGVAYVSIVAGNDINDVQTGVVSGCDSTVLIQAYNDIKSFVATRIVAGANGDVTILAGIDASGNVSGVYDADGNLIAGSIENLIVGLISGQNGVVNIAAGGSIDNLTAQRVISGTGEVNIVAGGDQTLSVDKVKSWVLTDETGVTFSAGGAVDDVKDTIKDENIDAGLGADVVFPDLPDLPQ